MKIICLSVTFKFRVWVMCWVWMMLVINNDDEEIENIVEVHLEEVCCSHELEDVPCLDRQLLCRAVIQVLHHLGRGSGRRRSRSRAWARSRSRIRSRA